MYQDHKIFLLRALRVVRFREHLKSLEVEDISELLLFTYHDFYRSGVLHTKTKHDKHYLIEKTMLIFHFHIIIEHSIRYGNVV